MKAVLLFVVLAGSLAPATVGGGDYGPAPPGGYGNDGYMPMPPGGYSGGGFNSMSSSGYGNDGSSPEPSSGYGNDVNYDSKPSGNYGGNGGSSGYDSKPMDYGGGGGYDSKQPMGYGGGGGGYDSKPMDYGGSGGYDFKQPMGYGGGGGGYDSKPMDYGGSGGYDSKQPMGYGGGGSGYDSKPMGYGGSSGYDSTPPSGYGGYDSKPIGYGDSSGYDSKQPMGYGGGGSGFDSKPMGYGGSSGYDSKPPSGYGSSGGYDSTPPSGYGDNSGYDSTPPSSYGGSGSYDTKPSSGYGNDGYSYGSMSSSSYGGGGYSYSSKPSVSYGWGGVISKTTRRCGVARRDDRDKCRGYECYYRGYGYRPELGINDSGYGYGGSGGPAIENNAGYRAHPWMAAILQGKERRFLCSGALLSDWAVITAANCVYRLGDASIWVRLGDWDIKTDNRVETYPDYESSVKRILPHPGFDPRTKQYDVAIIVLKRPVDLAKYPSIVPVCLPDKYDYVGGNCYTAGWHQAPTKEISEVITITDGSNQGGYGNSGYGSYGGYGGFKANSYTFYTREYSKILQEAAVKRMEKEWCQRELSSDRPYQLIRPQECIFGQRGDRACIADVGSPVVCERQDKLKREAASDPQTSTTPSPDDDDPDEEDDEDSSPRRSNPDLNRDMNPMRPVPTTTPNPHVTTAQPGREPGRKDPAPDQTEEPRPRYFDVGYGYDDDDYPNSRTYRDVDSKRPDPTTTPNPHVTTPDPHVTTAKPRKESDPDPRDPNPRYLDFEYDYGRSILGSEENYRRMSRDVDPKRPDPTTTPNPHATTPNPHVTTAQPRKDPALETTEPPHPRYLDYHYNYRRMSRAVDPERPNLTTTPNPHATTPDPHATTANPGRKEAINLTDPNPRYLDYEYGYEYGLDARSFLDDDDHPHRWTYRDVDSRRPSSTTPHPSSTTPQPSSTTTPPLHKFRIPPRKLPNAQEEKPTQDSERLGRSLFGNDQDPRRPYKGRRSTFTLEGVVSWTFDCSASTYGPSYVGFGESDRPAIVTRVRDVLDFVLGVLDAKF
ncbi:unnamed protein product [Darwinula stevensoni]|uniref:Peptidase S1 domain-containing protein n=1 Tax=Darwinula stevensoni TaxID=69355 RepID=A0A7R9ACR6_9CRUS|nr:unnamed protein product [Darwinula stevensoni]CAG0900423.1 unnamed protein product [Darwinula stevensoni]